MRMVLVGALMATVLGVGTAFAGMASDPAVAAGSESVAVVHYTNPSQGVVREDVHGAGAEFGLALASSGLSLIYHPFRMAYGVVGAALGGFAGWTTGGDGRTARGIWRPTVEGHYFIRPDHLDRTERFRFNGAVPPGRARYVVTEQVVSGSAPVSGSVETAPAEEPSLDDELEPDDAEE